MSDKNQIPQSKEINGFTQGRHQEMSFIFHKQMTGKYQPISVITHIQKEKIELVIPSFDDWQNTVAAEHILH